MFLGPVTEENEKDAWLQLFDAVKQTSIRFFPRGQTCAHSLSGAKNI